MKIVVADDSAFIRNILKRSIETHFEKAEIYFCDSGASALEVLRSTSVDWLITDLLMPEMTGQELIKEVKKMCSQPETIVISADVQLGTKEELNGLGVNRYINKPLSPDKIETLVQMLKGVDYA